MWECPKCGRSFKNTNQDHFCVEVQAITDYIAEQPDSVQPILNKIRETIRAAAPNASERISWRMPTFWQGENLIHFAAFKKHVGIYPGDLSLAPFEDRLAGYHRTKGAVQFPFDKPIDYALIADITKWRVSCVEQNGKHARDDKPKSADTDASKMTRKVYDMPDDVAAALDETDLWARYRARPNYQRNDYIGWIARAKRDETRRKRLGQMLDELRSGDAYMGMAYNAKTED